MVRAELLFGAAKSQQKERNSQKLLAFLAPLERLSFGGSAVEVYAKIRWKLEKTGRIIGPNGLVIAATCVAHHVTLVTRNTREFELHYAYSEAGSHLRILPASLLLDLGGKFLISSNFCFI